MKRKKAFFILLSILLTGCIAVQPETSAPQSDVLTIPQEIRQFKEKFDVNGARTENLYQYVPSNKPELRVRKIKVYPQEGISTLRHVTEKEIYFDHYLEDRNPEEIWVCVYHIETGVTEFILNVVQVADFLQQGGENGTAISSEPDLNFTGAYGDDIFVTFRGSINAGSKRFLCRYNIYTKKLTLIHDFPDEQAAWEFLDTPSPVLDEVLYFNEFVPIGENTVTPWLWSYHLVTGEKTKLSDNAYAPFIYENKIATVKSDGDQAHYTLLGGIEIFNTDASKAVFRTDAAQKILAASMMISVRNALLIDPEQKILKLPFGSDREVTEEDKVNTLLSQAIGYATLPGGEIQPIVISTNLNTAVDFPTTDGRYIAWFQQKSDPQEMPIWFFDTVKQQLIIVDTITANFGGYFSEITEEAIYFDVFTENADGTRQTYFYIVQKPD